MLLTLLNSMGEDNRTMWEHVSQHLAQLGEVDSFDALKVRLFSLSLTGTAFSWFSSLLPNSIDCWEQLERKFHDHPKNEIKLLELTLVGQGRDESVNDYVWRFRDTKNRCFNLTISKKDMTNLAFNGLRSYLQENLDGHTFITLSQLQQKALAQENRSIESKDNFKHTRRNVNYVDCDSIVLAMSLTMFMLLNSVGLARLNLILVILSSRFTKIGKKKLSLLLCS
jgi:hypothetical protein